MTYKKCGSSDLAQSDDPKRFQTAKSLTPIIPKVVNNSQLSFLRASDVRSLAAQNVQGLSTPHISTLGCSLFYVGGSKCKVQRPFEGTREQKGGGRRGKVSGFSQQSRHRFMMKLGETDISKLPLFCTLTFPDEYRPHIKDAPHWKRCLKRLINRFRRKFPRAALIWRLELINRKSGLYLGEYFPHFHLLVYGIDRCTMLSWLSHAWYECCGKLSDDHLRAGTNVECIRNKKHLFAYASKYMAKRCTPNALLTGRIWGIVQVENIPWVKALLTVLTDRQAITLIRYLRRFAKLRSRDYRSLSILLDAEFWYKRLDKLLFST